MNRSHMWLRFDRFTSASRFHTEATGNTRPYCYLLAAGCYMGRGEWPYCATLSETGCSSEYEDGADLSFSHYIKEPFYFIFRHICIAYVYPFARHVQFCKVLQRAQLSNTFDKCAHTMAQLNSNAPTTNTCIIYGL